LDSSGREIVSDLLRRHVEETGSPLAARLIEAGESALDEFVMLTPRDYKAVMNTRDEAMAQGLDPDGDEVWSRILEVTGG
jgi:glutamate synthase (NADPH/NADH) large chain